MPSRMVICEGLELNQFRSCGMSKGIERYGLTLGKGIWSFIWTPCLQLFGRVGFFGLISNFFYREYSPLSFADMIFMTLESHDVKTLYGMIGYMVETLGVWLRGEGCLAVHVNPGMGGWQTRHFRLPNDGYMKEIDRQMASSISLTDTPFGKAHDNTR